MFGKEKKTLPAGVVVPEKRFKIMVKEGSDGGTEVQAFEIPQTVDGSESPASFLVTVRDIEAETGLDFMSELPDNLQERIEKEKLAGMW